MKRETPFELDPEFDVLPYEERRDATDLKFWYGVKREAAARYRRIRNGLGAASVTAIAGLGFANYTEGIKPSTISSLAIGAGIGLLTGSASGIHGQAIEEEKIAARLAGHVGSMYERAELDPPAWTQELQSD